MEHGAATPESDRACDVFLAHNSKDKAAVAAIADRLRACGLNPWLDRERLRPGVSSVRGMSAAIQQVQAGAVFCGDDGEGPWQQLEVNALIVELAKRKCPVIPVVLPGCSRLPALPALIADHPWVDFRESDPEPLGALYWGITGRKLGQAPNDAPRRQGWSNRRVVRAIFALSLIAVVVVAVILWVGGPHKSTGSHHDDGGVVAPPLRPQREITVVITGTGHGQVSSQPDILTCTSVEGTCAATFASDTTVTLVAHPDPGATFVRWEGDGVACSGARCALPPQPRLAVVARFAAVPSPPPPIRQRTLRLSINGVGYVDSEPPGISCSPTRLSCSARFAAGKRVKLTARIVGDARYLAWHDSPAGLTICSGKDTCEFLLDVDKALSIDMLPVQKVTVEFRGDGKGTVANVSSGPIDCDSWVATSRFCSADFSPGTRKAFKAIPDKQSTFTRWSGDAASCGTRDVCDLTINRATLIIAEFRAASTDVPATP